MKASPTAPQIPNVRQSAHDQAAALGLDVATIIRKKDFHGYYERPCFDAEGKPTGKVDGFRYAIKHHLKVAGQGYELVSIESA